MPLWLHALIEFRTGIFFSTPHRSALGKYIVCAALFLFLSIFLWQNDVKMIWKNNKICRYFWFDFPLQAKALQFGGILFIIVLWSHRLLTTSAHFNGGKVRKTRCDRLLPIPMVKWPKLLAMWPLLQDPRRCQHKRQLWWHCQLQRLRHPWIQRHPMRHRLHRLLSHQFSKPKAWHIPHMCQQPSLVTCQSLGT